MLGARSRVGRFVVVGGLGFLVQAGMFLGLTSLAGWPWLPASAAAVEAAVLSNFVCHERWTWRDTVPATRIDTLRRLGRFHLAAGLVSTTANVALMALCVRAGLPPLAANACAVATLGIVNVVVADRWVFRAAPRKLK
jgi:putative flippase GtrA